jgi:hypothetical protein
VPKSDVHQGENELQARDGPATEPQEGNGGSSEEEGDDDTPIVGAIDEGEFNEEVLRRYEMEATSCACQCVNRKSDTRQTTLLSSISQSGD